jgi:hypothetical protein
MLFFASWFAYYALILFSVAVAIARLLRQWRGSACTAERAAPVVGRLRRVQEWMAGPPGRKWSKLIYIGTAALLLHFVAGASYEVWSGVLFP